MGLYSVDSGTNQSGQVVGLAAASASGASLDLTNNAGRGLHLIIDITTITGTTPSLLVTIQGRDPASGKYYTILASAALTAVGTTVLKVFPGATPAANLAVNDLLPRDWRVSYTIAGTTPAVTATISASVIQ